MNCQHCNDKSHDTLCPSCASMVKAATIEGAKEAAIRRDERERIAIILAHMGKCPPVECGDGCFACWREYLTPEE